MGVDCKGVHRTIHFGPSKTLECYIQETGRAGRDGGQSTSYLLFNNLLLAHVEKDMKAYIANSHECRRKILLQKFTSKSNNALIVPHLCCDSCANSCECGAEHCSEPGLIKTPSEKPISKIREVTSIQKNELYHKS